MRCVSYTRTVPWKNTANLLTIQEQNGQIAAYLREHKDLKLLKKYSDRKNDEMADDAFEQMVEDGMARKYDCIIVASVYYFGQSCPVAKQKIHDTLYAAGIHFIVVNENIDSSSYERKEIDRYFEEKHGEMHANIIFAWRKRQGDSFVLTNSVSFGYIRRNGVNHLEKDSSVEPYLDEVFVRYLKGEKLRDLAKWLNEQGVDTPLVHRKRIQGKDFSDEDPVWNSDKLRSIMSSFVYTGAVIDRYRRIVAENCHEPYITKEQFYALPCNRGDVGHRVPIRERYKNPNPLVYRSFCSCGEPLKWHYNDSIKMGVFYCRYCGEEKQIPEQVVFDMILKKLNGEAIKAHDAAVWIKEESANHRLEEIRANISERMKAILAEMNMEQFHRVALYEDFAAGKITNDEYQAECANYRAVHKNMSDRLSVFMDETRKWERALSLNNTWIQKFADYQQPQQFDLNFVKTYISKVIIDVEQASITLILHSQIAEWRDMLLDVREERVEYGTEE